MAVIEIERDVRVCRSCLSLKTIKGIHTTLLLRHKKRNKKTNVLTNRKDFIVALYMKRRKETRLYTLFREREMDSGTTSDCLGWCSEQDRDDTGRETLLEIEREGEKQEDRQISGEMIEN